MTDLYEFITVDNHHNNRSSLYNDNYDGVSVFDKMKQENSKIFPEFVEELKGISDGSGVDLDKIWMLNLVSELLVLIYKCLCLCLFVTMEMASTLILCVCLHYYYIIRIETIIAKTWQ